MLRFISKENIEDVVEHNTEPFLNEVGLETSADDVGEIGSDGFDPVRDDYVIEDEYGRIWSTEFARMRLGLLSGPSQPVISSFSNYGFLSVPFRQVPRRRVESREDLYKALGLVSNAIRQLYPRRVIVYRGQTQEYVIAREEHEFLRLFGSSQVLEPSIRPSGTRREPMSDAASIAWSLLVQRHLARSGVYAPAHRAMETGHAWPHATHLGPLINLAFAQHYGLPTPALDVTSDVGVALWFAFHTLRSAGNETSVSAASGGEGVVYMIAGAEGEYFGEDLPYLLALRPHRQHGGFLASNWGNSKNRVARYIAAAIYFPHSLADEILSELPAAEYLFPGPQEDKFVNLLQQAVRQDRHGSEALAEILNHVYWVEPAKSSRESMNGHALTEEVNAASDQNTESDPKAKNHDSAYDFARGMHLFGNGDLEGAEKYLRRPAIAGHLESATVLGLILTRRGSPEGEQWTRRAAEAGQPNAMNNLGLVYENRRQFMEAEHWFEKSAKAGVQEAAYNLGSLLARTGRRNEAEGWLMFPAEAGDPDAACHLGKLLYERGETQAAERWFRVGAEAGQAQACYNLAQLCQSGGRRDEAEQWFRKAKETGDPDASYRLEQLKNSSGNSR